MQNGVQIREQVKVTVQKIGIIMKKSCAILALGLVLMLDNSKCVGQEVILVDPPKSPPEKSYRYDDVRNGVDSIKGAFDFGNWIRNEILDRQARDKIQNDKNLIDSKLSNGEMVVFFVGTQQPIVGRSPEGEETTVAFPRDPEYVGSGSDYEQIRDEYAIKQFQTRPLNPPSAARLNSQDSHFIIVTRNPDRTYNMQTKYEYGDLYAVAIGNKKAREAAKYINSHGIGFSAVPILGYQQRELDRQIREILEQTRERYAREQQARERELRQPEKSRGSSDHEHWFPETPFLDRPHDRPQSSERPDAVPEKPTPAPTKPDNGPGPDKGGGPVIIQQA
jgi:hypothetical protein